MCFIFSTKVAWERNLDTCNWGLVTLVTTLVSILKIVVKSRLQLRVLRFGSESPSLYIVPEAWNLDRQKIPPGGGTLKNKMKFGGANLNPKMKWGVPSLRTFHPKSKLPKLISWVPTFYNSKKIMGANPFIFQKMLKHTVTYESRAFAMDPCFVGSLWFETTLLPVYAYHIHPIPVDGIFGYLYIFIFLDAVVWFLFFWGGMLERHRACLASFFCLSLPAAKKDKSLTPSFAFAFTVLGLDHFPNRLDLFVSR